MILVSNLLLLSVIGSKTKAFNNLGVPRKFSTKDAKRSKDGGMASISFMTEHQYLGKEYIFVIKFNNQQYPMNSNISTFFIFNSKHLSPAVFVICDGNIFQIAFLTAQIMTEESGLFTGPRLSTSMSPSTSSTCLRSASRGTAGH